MSTLPTKQYDHPATNLTEADGSPQGEDAEERYSSNPNQMLVDRSQRGINAYNTQQNRNSDLRNRSLRGVFNLIKATREAP